MISRKFFLFFSASILIVNIIMLSSCANTEEKENPYAKVAADILLKQARSDLKDEKYQIAVEKYEAILSYHPFIDLAKFAQLEIIYVYYKNENYIYGYAAANDYLNIHPDGPYLDYIYYLKGLINFEKNIGTLEKIFKLNISNHDLGNFIYSFSDFSKLIELYPQSIYATDARQRMIYIKNLFAQHELNIAKFYLKRDAYIAALNRFQYVVQHFPDTVAAYKSIALMPKVYNTLTLSLEHQQAVELVKNNKLT